MPTSEPTIGLILSHIAVATAPNTLADSVPRRWHPSPAIRASYGLHAASAAAALLMPETWPWALGLVGANHVVLTGAGLMPRSCLLGANLTRLSATATSRREIALTFDDGPDPDLTPRVLDRLDASVAKATFFVVGTQARRYPELTREIVRRGHAVENHSFVHSMHFPWYGPRRLEHDISAAQAAIADACGHAPIFFRAPMGFRTPLLEPVLARLGLHLASWTRRGFDTVEHDPSVVAARLSRDLAAGDILLMHDGVAILGRSRPATTEALDRLLTRIAEHNLVPVTLRSACCHAGAA